MSPPALRLFRARNLALGLLFVACSSSPATDGGADASVPAAPTKPDASVSTPSEEAGPPAEAPCVGGVTETCTAWNERATCAVVDGKRTWKKEPCADGCFAGKCSTTACVDECMPGEAGCQLWDMASKSFVAANATTSLNDRARDYEARLRSTSLVNGQVLNVNYTDETRATVASYSGYRDAAIWTGSALAAESWRALATGSPDAAARIDALVRTLHRNFEVTAEPGYMARFVVPKTGPQHTYEAAPTCGSNDWHCNATSKGQTYDWVGGTSRDQYTGVMLGYTMAYLATTSDELKELIRGDVVAVALELAKQRKAVPLRIVIDEGIPLDKDVDLENVILSPSEMVNGRIEINLAGGDVSESGSTGIREFFPDLKMLLKPVLGIGTSVPRSSSAIMLGGIFEAALLMSSESESGAMKAAHQQLAAYYAAHASSWANIGKGWTFSTRDGCGRGYYSTHIALIMEYVWASLVKDPALRPVVNDEIFSKAMWNGVKTHKNAYFAYLWSGTRGAASLEQPVVDAANAQLAQFEPGPRVWIGRDVTTSPAYLPHDTTCTEVPHCDTKTNAVDVKDRRIDDFIWQRQPWQLLDAGFPRRVFPGVDYLAAYWAARRHGLLADDRAGTCGRKAP